MKYTILAAVILLAACNTKTEEKPMTFARAITYGTTIRQVTDSGDTLIITYTPSSYTASRLDTVIRKKGEVVTTPPVVVDPPVTPSTGYGTLAYSLDFSKAADLDPFKNNQFGNGSIVNGQFKSVPANVSSGIRSEVQFPASLTPTEGAIEYDVMYETVFQNNGHSLQFHPNTSGGSASPGLWHIDGKFVWVNWKGGTNTKYPTGFTIPKGKWMHIVFEYKIGSSGYMKFTVDGAVLLDRKGIQVGDGSGQYLKVGTNQWVSAPSVVYYDNIRIWKK